MSDVRLMFGMISGSARPNVLGDIISPDAIITIPEKGINVTHDGLTLFTIPQAHVDVVSDVYGHILYMSVSEDQANGILANIRNIIE